MTERETLAYKLRRYAGEGVYPFHMPGHKRRVPPEIARLMERVYELDVTETPCTDNLFRARGILAEAMEYARAVYKSDATHFLINGSSCGILAALGLLSEREGVLLMGENSHFSAHHAARLFRMTGEYLHHRRIDSLPEVTGAVDCSALEGRLKAGGVCGVYVTSPSYGGIISDIASIAEICRRFGVPLVVDEAHGAHLPFMRKWIGPGALSLGADLVIQSLHKTLPAPTQTALLHLREGILSPASLQQWLTVFESSSPSYILMAAIDLCIRYCHESAGEEIAAYMEALERFFKEVSLLPEVAVWGPTEEEKKSGAVFCHDFTKILIRAKDVEGILLAGWLRKKAAIETEYSLPTHVLALSSFLDAGEGLDRLRMALTSLCAALSRGERPLPEREDVEAFFQRLLAEEGQILRNPVYVYPPGTPLLSAGDRLDRRTIERLCEFKAKGYCVRGFLWD